MSTKAKIQDIYPLTPMQEGMLFHSLNRQTALAYFEQTAYRLHGKLDIEMLKKSLDELMKRHDILRTAFVHEGVKRPMQVVLQERKCDFLFKDVSRLENFAAKESAAADIADNDRQRPFDLKKDVLLRVTVIKLSEEDYEFVWSHPHIIMDGWCLGIIVAEFLEFYVSFIENRPPVLQAAPPFKRYISWLGRRNVSESLDYWEKYLENYLSAAVIPGIKSPRSGKNGFAKKTVVLTLQGEEFANLNKLTVKNAVTMNVVVQTCWGLVLGKYKGEHDVVFGAVVSGRPAEVDGIETMIGLFVNTIPVRIRVNGEQKFVDLLQKVQREALAGEPHHYCSLVDIQARSAVKRNLIDHILVFKNFPIGEQIAGAVVPKRNGGEKNVFAVSNITTHEHTNFDFKLDVIETGKLTLRFIYNANVYEEQLIEKIAGHLKRVLTQDLENMEIERMRSLYTDKEKKREMLETFNENLEDE